jgi:hypothetical protein
MGGTPWWTWVLPPVWFAGIDDALVGSGARVSWLLATAGCAISATVLRLAFGKLANQFEAGLQILNESTGRRVRSTARSRLLDRLINRPPLCWWLRDPQERAAFLLAAAYMTRDRDTKLRLYPAIAPFLALPVMFLFRDVTSSNRDNPLDGFGIMLSSGYLGAIPAMALNLLQYSQQWRAADLFRAAPLAGPAAVCHGSRKAVLILLMLPLVLLFAGGAWLVRGDADVLLLLLPGVLPLPVLALVPHLGGKGVLLSQPVEQAKSVSRGLTLMGTMLAAIAVSAVAMAARQVGMFVPFLAVETVCVAGMYFLLCRSLNRAAWPASE